MHARGKSSHVLAKTSRESDKGDPHVNVALCIFKGLDYRTRRARHRTRLTAIWETAHTPYAAHGDMPIEAQRLEVLWQPYAMKLT